MGFGYNKLKTLNKRLVYASISGFGGHGPDHDKPGYDMVASAVGGLMSLTGHPVLNLLLIVAFFLTRISSKKVYLAIWKLKKKLIIFYNWLKY